MSYEDYDRIQAVRWSHLKLLLDGSLAHYKWAVDHPDTGDTTSRRVLRAIHSAILEPDRHELDWGTYPGRRNDRDYKARMLAHPERELYPEKHRAKVEGMAAAAHAHPVAGPILLGEDGWSEVPITWEHPGTGILCKARLDRLRKVGDNQVEVWDLKTVGASADPRTVRLMALRMAWIGQQAHYREGLQVRAAARGEQMEFRCGLICIEDRPPYDLAVYRLREQDLADAAADREVCLAELADAMRDDHWPGRCEEVAELNMTPWLEEEISGLEEG